MKNIEIERKYLVCGEEFKLSARQKCYIKQGYLVKDEENTIRIRIKDEKAFITFKGKSTDDGLCRFELEEEIRLQSAELLLRRCKGVIIEKVRWIVPFNDLIIEVDEFLGENTGLILAEIELDSTEQTIPQLPNWIEKEVTGDKRYYNSFLSSTPFSKW
ncbi:MAG: CYTH domain-containing protein [Bacteroidales bacterium]|nr:CYTH domain-containing protein [Bacteroidales bacterium]